ncbi:MAG: type II toxin-antitoxin system VapB family antitoxin [Planctomycetes bacterium]|nr:type II toxin-antitoxin system VapB family antitoxin [Planctomycetota bacterium]
MRRAIARQSAAKTGGTPSLKEELLAIGRRCAALPDHDSRPADKILGYDDSGLPS